MKGKGRPEQEDMRRHAAYGDQVVTGFQVTGFPLNRSLVHGYLLSLL
jgi:hypothetical protein